MDDELLDLVDRNDNVIGTINRRDYKRLITDNLGYIRAAELFIVNSKGQIYTPVRTAHKTIAPNGYDYSAAGHVGAGDDYTSAMVREAQEELNITILPKNLELVAKMTSETVRYIRSVFLLRSDETPVLNLDDFANAQWLYPEEVIENINNGHPAKTDMAKTVRRLQEYLQQTDKTQFAKNA